MSEVPPDIRDSLGRLINDWRSAGGHGSCPHFGHTDERGTWSTEPDGRIAFRGTPRGYLVSSVERHAEVTDDLQRRLAAITAQRRAEARQRPPWWRRLTQWRKQQ